MAENMMENQGNEKKSFESPEQPLHMEEISRYQPPNIALVEGKVYINDELLSSLENEEMDSLDLSPDGRTIVAYKKSEEYINEKNFRDDHNSRVVIVSYDPDQQISKITKEIPEGHFEKEIFKQTGDVVGCVDIKNNDKREYHPFINELQTDISANYELHSRQKNIIQIQDYKKDEFILKNTVEPGKQYPRIKLGEGRRDGGKIFINGLEWPDLSGQDIYSGGLKVKLDLETGGIFFRGDDRGGATFVHNNKKWKNKIEHAGEYNVKNNRASVLTQKSLFINDQEWVNDKWGGQEDNDSSYLKSYDVGADGTVAVSRCCRTEDNKTTMEIISGNAKGPDSIWKTRLLVEKIKAESGLVAAIGRDEAGNSILVINDIPQILMDNVSEVIDLNINKEQKVNLRYKNGIGQFVEQVFSLKPDSPEILKRSQEKNQNESALTDLKTLIAERGMSPRELLEKYPRLEGEVADLNKKYEGMFGNFMNTDKELSALKQKTEGKIDELTGENKRLDRSNQELSRQMSTLKDLFAKAQKGGLLNKNYTIDKDTYSKIEDILS